MTCPTVSDHDWSGPRLRERGVHDIRGPYLEYSESCASCGRVRTWREWCRESVQHAGRVGLTKAPVESVTC